MVYYDGNETVNALLHVVLNHVSPIKRPATEENSSTKNKNSFIIYLFNTNKKKKTLNPPPTLDHI